MQCRVVLFETVLIQDSQVYDAGPCQAEVDQFCFEVKPGEGRLAKCIVEQLAEQEKPGYTETKISETCKTTLDKFVVDRAGENLLSVPSQTFASFTLACINQQGPG